MERVNEIFFLIHGISGTIGITKTKRQFVPKWHLFSSGKRTSFLKLTSPEVLNEHLHAEHRYGLTSSCFCDPYLVRIQNKGRTVQMKM